MTDPIAAGVPAGLLAAFLQKDGWSGQGWLVIISKVDARDAMRGLFILLVVLQAIV